jgi:hypothetical protein
LFRGKKGDDLVEAVECLDISVQSEVALGDGRLTPGKDTIAMSAGSVRGTETDGTPELGDCSSLLAPQAAHIPYDSGNVDVGIIMYEISCLLIEARSLSLFPFNCHLHRLLSNRTNISNAPIRPLILKMKSFAPLR